MAREITDDEIKEWMKLLTEQETMEFFDGINIFISLYSIKGITVQITPKFANTISRR